MGKRGRRGRSFREATSPTPRGRKLRSTQLRKIAAKAPQDPKPRFTSLAHLRTPDVFRETWQQLNRKGASGIDGATIERFETNLEERLYDLWRRRKGGQYQAPPVRRVEIPKGHGPTRPLGIPMACAYCISSPSSLGMIIVEAVRQSLVNRVQTVAPDRDASHLAERRVPSI
jgi:hypothetical protein